jgi:hypothetical protein
VLLKGEATLPRAPTLRQDTRESRRRYGFVTIRLFAMTKP